MVSDPESGANLNIGCPNLIDLFTTMTTADMNKDEPQTTNEVHVIENEEKRRVNYLLPIPINDNERSNDLCEVYKQHFRPNVV